MTTFADTFNLSEAGTLDGPSPLVRRQYSPTRKAAIAEAARMWERVWQHGDARAALQVKEALSTSDLFVSATGDVLDRELLAAYTDIDVQWPLFARRTTVGNFKPKKLVDLLGGRSDLALVPELTEYPTADYRTREYEIRVRKFGRRFAFSWEASINDDLDELMQVPGQFATAARLTEERAALELIADPTTGAPNTGFFRDYTGDTDSKGQPLPGPNTTPSTLALTADNLQTALTTVTTRRDFEGNLVAPGRLLLVVGVAQEFAARRILEATEIRTTSGSRQTVEANYLRGAVDLVVHRRLPGNAWFLLPAPTEARPALAVAFLRGFETPDIRQKADQGVGAGPDSGSFEIDDAQWRVRHVLGAATLLPLHTYASTGAGA